LEKKELADTEKAKKRCKYIGAWIEKEALRHKLYPHGYDGKGWGRPILTTTEKVKVKIPPFCKYCNRYHF
jgi:hypothetical protein